MSVADDGGVIGVILLIAHEDDLLIENVAVEPSPQRKGWWDALMADAETKGRSRGSARCGRTRTHR